MATSPKLISSARKGLHLIVDGVFLNAEHAGYGIPRPEQWSDFIRENPQFLDYSIKSTAHILAADRKVYEGMDLAFERLAGTVIRASFSDEELIRKIHQD